MTKLNPLDDRIVIEVLEAEERTAGGIVLPDQLQVIADLTYAKAYVKFYGQGDKKAGLNDYFELTQMPVGKTNPLGRQGRMMRREVALDALSRERLAAFVGEELRFEGDEIAAQSLLWVLRLAEGDKAVMQRAIQTLLEVHMESPALADLASQLRYAGYQLGPEPVQKALRDIFEFSPHDKVRGNALWPSTFCWPDRQCATHRLGCAASRLPACGAPSMDAVATGSMTAPSIIGAPGTSAGMAGQA